MKALVTRIRVHLSHTCTEASFSLPNHLDSTVILPTLVNSVAASQFGLETRWGAPPDYVSKHLPFGILDDPAGGAHKSGQSAPSFGQENVVWRPLVYAMLWIQSPYSKDHPHPKNNASIRPYLHNWIWLCNYPFDQIVWSCWSCAPAFLGRLL